MIQAEHTLFLLNPNAGSGRAARIWNTLCGQFPELRAQTICCGHPKELPALLEDTLTPSVKKLIVVGGDGSVHHLVNALMQSELKVPVNVGILPAGNGSDFSRHLGITRRGEEALRFLLSAQARPVDLFRIRTDEGTLWSVNITSLGLSAAVAHAMNSSTNGSGKHYIGGALQELRKWKGCCFRLQVDGRTGNTETYDLILFANGGSFGNGLQIMPHASVTDGLGNLLVIRSQPRWKLLLALSLVPFGKHLKLRFAEHQTFTRATVAAENGGKLVFEADGETYHTSTMEIEVVQAGFRMLC